MSKDQIITPQVFAAAALNAKQQIHGILASPLSMKHYAEQLKATLGRWLAPHVQQAICDSSMSDKNYGLDLEGKSFVKALYQTHIDYIKAVLEAGVDFEELEDANGIPALQALGYRSDIWDFFEENKLLVTAHIFIAAEAANYDALELLVKEGFSLDTADSKGRTVLGILQSMNYDGQDLDEVELAHARLARRNCIAFVQKNLGVEPKENQLDEPLEAAFLTLDSLR